MSDDLDVNKAQTLLKSAHDLRMHWSGHIIQIMYFTIIALLAVWTLNAQVYMQEYNSVGFWYHAYLANAAVVSIVLLIIWRLYTKRLDNGIAHLYPELIYFEGILSCPSEYGTNAYLERNLGKAGEKLNSITDFKIKADVVKQLVDKKRIGGRLHNYINWTVLVIIAICVFIVLGLGIFECPKIVAGAVDQGSQRYRFKWLF